jgi:hypothetical protein
MAIEQSRNTPTALRSKQERQKMSLRNVSYDFIVHFFCYFCTMEMEQY